MVTHPPVRAATITVGDGNFLVVDVPDDAARQLLAEQFSYTHRFLLRGPQAAALRHRGGSPVRTERVACYDIDPFGRFVLAFGFLERCVAVLRSAGYEVFVRDRPPTEREQDVFRPRFDVVASAVSLRYRQDEFLAAVAAYRCGRFDCAPGYGKSFMIGVIALAFPLARIAVVTRRVGVLRDRIYPELLRLVPDTGIVGGGRRVLGRRVMCYTSASLHHALDTEWDMVIVDECHEAASDDTAYKLARLPGRPRMFGLSGTQDMRWDNKDMRCEALFGPVRMRVGYAEGVAQRVLVPLVVRWSDVRLPHDPASGRDGIERKRHAIWRNAVRNQIIATDARRHPGEQVIVTCETVEHLVHLRQWLPEAVLVYASGALERGRDRRGRNRRDRYVEAGLLSADEPVMTPERLQSLFRDLQDGRPGIYLCTGVVNVGLDLKHCVAVCRAEGTASAILDTQVPGRASRADGVKRTGFVYDYLDQFSPGFFANARRRSRHYARHGWRQEFPGGLDPFMGPPRRARGVLP